MPTITHQYDFYVNLEGFVEQAVSSEVAGSQFLGDGVPIGCFRWRRTSGGTGEEIEKMWDTSHPCWIDFGVPPGKIVTQVECTGFRHRSAGTDEDSTAECLMQIVYGSGGSEGDPVHTGTLFAFTPALATPTPWSSSAGAGDLVTIVEAAQPSETLIRMELRITTETTNLSSSDVDVRIDTVVLVITYEDILEENPDISLEGEGSCSEVVLTWEDLA